MMSEESLQIPCGKVTLDGDLTLIENAKGIVLFAHGSGSGRKSPRNRYVAGVLQKSGLITLLFDLLTKEEEVEDNITAALRFDITFLAKRLQEATSFVKKQKSCKNFLVGYFGASTGAAAALIAAAKDPDVKAVVSRGGRPDLARESLPIVQAPTLLIVGGADYEVIKLNEQALSLLTCKKKLEIVPGATHLFEERGTLEKVADLARGWFCENLSKK